MSFRNTNPGVLRQHHQTRLPTYRADRSLSYGGISNVPPTQSLLPSRQKNHEDSAAGLKTNRVAPPNSTPEFKNKMPNRAYVRRFDGRHIEGRLSGAFENPLSEHARQRITQTSRRRQPVGLSTTRPTPVSAPHQRRRPRHDPSPADMSLYEAVAAANGEKAAERIFKNARSSDDRVSPAPKASSHSKASFPPPRRTSARQTPLPSPKPGAFLKVDATISKDNTGSESVRSACLLAAFGQRQRSIEQSQLSNVTVSAPQPSVSISSENIPLGMARKSMVDFGSMKFADTLVSDNIITDFDFDSFLHEDGDNQSFDFNTGTLS